MTATLSSPPSVAARPLFEALYGNAREGLYFAIWTTPSKATWFFSADAEGIDAALAKVDELDGTEQNVFISTYLLDAPKKRGRGEEKDSRAIVALWADIDIAGPTHKAQTNYPKTAASAVEIAKSLPLAPSMIVHSGGGVHAWWFFPEPLYLDTADDRADVLDIMKRWKEAVRQAASAHGSNVDSVFDLARVMRVPGSLNHKESPVRSVVLEADPTRTYGQLDIEEILPDAPDLWIKGKAEPIDMAGIDLRYLAVKHEKVALALEGDQKFKLTWEMKRKDMADQSTSSYCFAIGQYLVKLGLTDEQIVQTIHTWRKDVGAVSKDDRWYAREVGRYRQVVGIESSTAEMLDDFKAGEITEQPAALDLLSQLLGFPIDRFQRIDGARVTYRLRANGYDRNIGGSETITSFTNFKRAMTDFDVTLKKFSQKAWDDDVVKVLLAAAEKRDLGQGDTEAGRARRWITHFLSSRSLIDENAPGRAYRERRAFIRRGHVAFFAEHLLDFVQKTFKTENLLSEGELEQALEQAGCRIDDKKVDTTVDGSRLTGYVWQVPHEIYHVEEAA